MYSNYFAVHIRFDIDVTKSTFILVKLILVPKQDTLIKRYRQEKMQMIQQEKMKRGQENSQKTNFNCSFNASVNHVSPAICNGLPAAMNNSSLTYETTKKTVIEKAKLLTETYGTTSLQYALIDGGEIVVSGQTGKNDINDKVPLTSNTVYGIGSTSKMMLTAAVMKLVDEGKIDLDVPVVNYMPDFTMKDNRYKQITPRMLLNHSSGLLGTQPAMPHCMEIMTRIHMIRFWSNWRIKT